MINILKQIFSFVLPVTVLVIVPMWVEKDWTVTMSFHFFAGCTVMAIGLAIMFMTITLFMRVGKGTLAPWSPPKHFVVRGPYRYVRNPMIMGVISVLLGEALSFWSKSILLWAGEFFVINIIYFLIYEEPNLAERFGESYKEYKKHVSMWWPRMTPYDSVSNENPASRIKNPAS